jgi:hypothetical protein
MKTQHIRNFLSGLLLTAAIYNPISAFETKVFSKCGCAKLEEIDTRSRHTEKYFNVDKRAYCYNLKLITNYRLTVAEDGWDSAEKLLERAAINPDDIQAAKEKYISFSSISEERDFTTQVKSRRFIEDVCIYPELG